MDRKPSTPRSNFLQLLESSAFISSLVNGGLEGAARQTHVSGRTIRRRLRDEGTCARDVVRSHRQMMLRALLLVGASGREIAAELGFATPQSLNRFSRIEFGDPVESLRQRLLALEPDSPLRNPRPERLTPARSLAETDH